MIRFVTFPVADTKGSTAHAVVTIAAASIVAIVPIAKGARIHTTSSATFDVKLTHAEVVQVLRITGASDKDADRPTPATVAQRAAEKRARRAAELAGLPG